MFKSIVIAALFAIACSPAVVASNGFPAEPYASASSPSGMYAMELRTSPQPPSRGAISALLKVTCNAVPADGLALHVTPWMPSMGHGASTEPTVVAQGNGNYLIDDLVLPMPGTWELRVSTSDGSEPTVLSLSVE
jgi:hypothetical protein